MERWYRKLGGLMRPELTPSTTPSNRWQTGGRGFGEINYVEGVRLCQHPYTQIVSLFLFLFLFFGLMRVRYASLLETRRPLRSMTQPPSVISRTSDYRIAT